MCPVLVIRDQSGDCYFDDIIFLFLLRRGAFCDVEFVLVTYLSQFSLSEFPILGGIYHGIVSSPTLFHFPGSFDFIYISLRPGAFFHPPPKLS